MAGVEKDTVRDLGRAGNFDPSAYQAVLAARLRAIEQKRDKETKAECVKDLLRIATQQGYTTGKWLLFAKPEFVDAVWRIVATATANGELGCSAKVSPAAGVADNVLICVYVRDFNERSELRRVLDKLMKLMPKEGDLKFFFAGYSCADHPDSFSFFYVLHVHLPLGHIGGVCGRGSYPRRF